MIRYQAKLNKDKKGYWVEFPDLPGCLSDGQTKEKALANAKESLSLYLEEARDPEWEVPVPKSRKGKNYIWITPSLDIAIPLMLRQIRRKHQFTQTRLAKELGINVQQLQKLEMPGKSNPTVKTLARIAKALGSDLEIKIA